tara:strand:+ start:1035 stop:1289 length:255 start_codon:yes stop_codon:yes gene_type:complete
MTFLSYLATVFGTAMALGNLPQAYRIFRRKSAKDLSILTFSIWFVGALIWIMYGLELGDSPLVIANTIGFFTLGLVIIGWALYR